MLRSRFLYGWTVVLLGLAACTGTPDAHSEAAQPARVDLDPQDRAGWRQVLGWPDACEEDFALGGTITSGITLHPLGAEEHLVEVTCLVAAYQHSMLFFTYGAAAGSPAVRQLRFRTYYWDDQRSEWQPEETAELTGLATFAAATRELTVATKFHGAGLCGSEARYRIAHGQAELLEFLGQPDCGDPDRPWRRVAPGEG